MSNTPSKHDCFVESNDTFIAFSDKDKKVLVLPPGIYDASIDMFQRHFYTTIDLKMDEILELPDSNMAPLLDKINQFWSVDMGDKYKEYGLLQKLGILLHGKPGTGKTCLIARIAKEVVNNFQGVILFNPDVSELSRHIKVIREVEPNKKIVVIWEEFDSIIDHNESELLCLLDGEIQAENIVYLATTNYISQIPARIKNRPSRFSIVQEIGLPTKEARHTYFNCKLKSKADKDKYLAALTEASEAFSIDQCKDLIISVLLFNIPISDAVIKLQEMQDDHSIGRDDYNEETSNEVFKTRKKEPLNRGKPLRPMR